jgi:hypothetical protein
MTVLYIVLVVLGVVGFTVGLTWYAIHRINQGAPGWVAPSDENALGSGPCPKGDQGTEGKPGEKSAA